MIERTDLLLSVQRALLGAVPASLRAVACGWTEEKIVLRFIFDGPIDPDDEEDLQVAGTEVIADFSAPATIDEQFIRADSPVSLNAYALRAWAYMRKEPMQTAT